MSRDKIKQLTTIVAQNFYIFQLIIIFHDFKSDFLAIINYTTYTTYVLINIKNVLFCRKINSGTETELLYLIFTIILGFSSASKMRSGKNPQRPLATIFTTQHDVIVVKR